MATLTGEFQLALAPEVQVAERIDVGTLDGQPLTIEREFSGTFVGWIGQEAVELTENEYNELRALVVR